MTTAGPVRVLLAADQPMLRTGYRTVLASAAGVAVVGEAGDGAEAVDLARRLVPDVVLMSVRLPRLDGVAATRAIVAAALPVRVLLLTTDATGDPVEVVAGDDSGVDPDEQVVGALRAGACGFLARDVTAGDLVTAIRAVAAGEAVVGARILRRLLDQFAAPAGPAPGPARPALAGLTEREREVLVLVARGLSNAEIAGRLAVGETTVKTHVGRVLTKLGLRDRVQAVVLAYESGLIRPGG